MGTWSAEPFGNDSAADWAWELEEADSWDFVRETLTAVAGGEFDDDDATLAIAAAEVVAHGLGRPTEGDENAAAFAERMPAPDADLVALAITAVAAATAPDSPLAEMWEGDPDWAASGASLAAALRGDEPSS